MRVNLFDKAKGSKGDVGDAPPGYSAVFEYRALPQLKMSFAPIGRPDKLPPLKCGTVKNAGAVKPAPTMQLDAGKEVQVQVDVLEMLTQGDTKACTHVDGEVQLHSRLGLDSVCRSPHPPKYNKTTTKASSLSLSLLVCLCNTLQRQLKKQNANPYQ